MEAYDNHYLGLTATH
ncbi:unnamed protein product, partial [Rotaria magnacalcarata]